MPVQREAILWDIDWDGLDPLPQVEQSPHTGVPVEAQSPAAGAAIEPPPVEQRMTTPEIQRGEPVTQAPPAHSATLSPPKPHHAPPPLPPPPSVALTPLPLNSSDRLSPSHQPCKDLVPGERFDLGPIFAQKPQISIELISSKPAAVKLICLGLDAAEIVAGTAYCVGPRQPSSPCGGITHAARTDRGQEIIVCASILPANIKRLEVAVVTSDSAASLGNTMEGIRLWAGDMVVAESRHLDPACASSSCATLVEIYERQGSWRMRMIGAVLARSVNDLLAKHGAKTN